MLQTLHSLDLAVDSVVSDLGSRGWLDNTFVMYLSDNGYFWGEHRLLTKDRVYEEAHRIPCAVRYPPLVAVPRQEDGLTANIDLAPTFCDLARVPIPATVNGRSLLPLLSETGSWREDLLLEGFSQPTYAAIESGQYVYVENTGDQSELYDLLSDPYQLTSQQDNALYSTLIDQLRVRLQQLKAE
jgi:arylsulfatase A-like enzyme